MNVKVEAERDDYKLKIRFLFNVCKIGYKNFKFNFNRHLCIFIRNRI